MNEAEFSIGPIQLLFHQVYGQTVGPVYVDIHYHFPVRDRGTKLKRPKKTVFALPLNLTLLLEHLFCYSCIIVTGPIQLNIEGVLYYKHIIFNKEGGFPRGYIVTLPVAAIHASTLYPGFLSPVGPVHVAGRKNREEICR